jgi:hypothetical protein
MISKVIPATFAILLAASAGAYADQMTTGIVKNVDMAAKTVTMENGFVYHLPFNYVNDDLTAGKKVQLSWSEKKNHEFMIDKIAILG